MLSQTNMLSEKQKTESETKPFKVIPSWADDNWNGFASN